MIQKESVKKKKSIFVIPAKARIQWFRWKRGEKMVMNNKQPIIHEKYKKLETIILDLKKVLVAFSGGVDSTFLLKTAVDLLGNERVLAVTAISNTMSRQEGRDARTYAENIRVEHVELETHELDIPEFVQNPKNKCYICKKHRFGSLVKLSQERGFNFVVDGENADDHLDFRPGSIAAKELGIRSPLREAGITKKEIRHFSKESGLLSWNKPSFACLASRIPYHELITAEKLNQVDEGEEFLRKLGFLPQLRVRHYGNTARIELDDKDFRKLVQDDIRVRIVHFFKSLGFEFITIDLEGYNMGSLNREINKT
jgi:pyridinium-3,5-biscarboxylic acid mononucleotide sulfurtransferase